MTKRPLLFLALPVLGTMALVAGAAEGEVGITTTELLIALAVIIVLVLLNGLYVGAEFAIIGVRPTQMEQMAEEGNRTARSVLDILQSRAKQDGYIATAQLGITIASLGLAQYGEPKIAAAIEPLIERFFHPSEAVLHTLGYVISLSFLTYLHVVIGEMVPKSLALGDAKNAVIRLAGPMRVSSTILGPAVRILNAAGNGILRLMRVPPAEGHARVLSPEELELIVDESAESGLLENEERDFIRNIFDFSNRSVEQVMTPRPRVETFALSTPQDELFQLAAESRHSRFPVYETDREHIIGIIHVKDLARQLLRRPEKFDLRLIMRSAPAVPEGTSIATLLNAIKAQKMHMAIVLDEFGGMAGIVTLEDLVEEVVGEVRDEFDQEREPLIHVGPGILDVAGDILVEALLAHAYLGELAALPDVETVGGLIVSKLGRPPIVGDVVTYADRVHFRVLTVDRRAVTRARIEFPAEDHLPTTADEPVNDEEGEPT